MSRDVLDAMLKRGRPARTAHKWERGRPARTPDTSTTRNHPIALRIPWKMLFARLFAELVQGVA